MALSHAPQTELEAVNMMLAGIGETPVSVVPSSGVSDAVEAQAELHRVNRETQGMALKFNTDYKVQLSPDGDSKINIPTNALRVVSYYRGMNYDYVVRGRYLYDRYNQQYTFSTYVLLNITYFLEWSLLPEHVRHYVSVRASRKFQANAVGSQVLHGFTERDEALARADLMRWEMIKKSDTILESSGPFSIVNRRA